MGGVSKATKIIRLWVEGIREFTDVQVARWVPEEPVEPLVQLVFTYRELEWALVCTNIGSQLHQPERPLIQLRLLGSWVSPTDIQTLGFWVFPTDIQTLGSEMCSVMDARILQPIQISKYGEALVIEAGQTDIDQIPTILKHAVCRGSMDRIQVSPTHQALCCRRCHFRVVFPLEVVRFVDLRRYMHRVLPEPWE